MERATLQTDDSTELEIDDVTVEARTLAEAAFRAAQRRVEGYDGDRYISTNGDIYSERVKTNLVHVDELVDYDELFRGHPVPLKSDDDYEEIREIVIEQVTEELIDKHTETIEAGDAYYGREITEWDEVFSAPADRYGNIENALYRTPEGQYVHVTYRPGESVKTEEGDLQTVYTVKQVGGTISTRLLSGDDREVVDVDGVEAEYLIGDAPVYDAWWDGDNISVATLVDGYEKVAPLDELRDAGEYDVTFEISLEGGA